MYKKGYGIIETRAPLHVGASAGEETGNLNLIFRDQFTQTGIIPGSSIRGRFRADMREKRLEFIKQQKNIDPNQTEENITIPQKIDDNYWYGQEATKRASNITTEAQIKFEYASLVWLPVFCPGQPIVWITCPWLLKRYKQITGINEDIPDPYTAPKNLRARDTGNNSKILFFNLGFLEIPNLNLNLTPWLPEGVEIPESQKSQFVVVADNDIAMIHDMALYRQSRVKLEDKQKKVDGGGFFNVEALPEGSILIFPVAMKNSDWQPFTDTETTQELYFGGLESIGFGRCQVTLFRPNNIVNQPENTAPQQTTEQTQTA